MRNIPAMKRVKAAMNASGGWEFLMRVKKMTEENAKTKAVA